MRVLLLFSALADLRQCPECLPEPVEVTYWGSSLEPRTITKADFRKSVRDGRVLVLTNATRGPFEGFTCDDFVATFPDARMRREYDWETNPSDADLQRVGDKSWLEKKVVGAGPPPEARPGGPASKAQV